LIDLKQLSISDITYQLGKWELRINNAEPEAGSGVALGEPQDLDARAA